MKRFILPGLFALGVFALGLALAGNPGRASADWLGWRIDTSAAFVLAVGLALAAALAALWTGAAWLVHAPVRAARARAEAARRDGLDRLTRGYLALAAGEPTLAARLAAEARAPEAGAPVLARLLAAQAAEAEGDDGTAQAAYAALLDAPGAGAAARRGLARLALRRDLHGEAVPAPPPVDMAREEALRLGP